MGSKRLSIWHKAVEKLAAHSIECIRCGEVEQLDSDDQEQCIQLAQARGWKIRELPGYTPWTMCADCSKELAKKKG